MVIKKAEYRGLNEGNVCGSSYNYSCSFDVTCHLKRRCDGQRVCNISVDNNLFPSNICVGLNKYLYFEYQCNDTMTSLDDMCYDTTGFFLKHVETGKCIYDTEKIQSSLGARTLRFLELSHNCLHPASQFKFLVNSAIMKLNVPSCLQGVHKWVNGYRLDVLYIHTDTHNINYVACVNNNAENKPLGEV
ncbi:uncharacterized protein LOC124451786 [Xenia sp. Carnegie-2017]|uniref:uncharacterized protein LOC124451786 n=1 Tax=Xenia sp. Carnegie-2017 TaxID=2897299 RepID=UPI001F03ABF9|nr:uncharacterized protein LOC124451786 [Xenia sp. Carnegie-2017]